MKTKLALVLLLVFAIALPASTQDVVVDYDHSIDFTQYHTFAWATGAYPVRDAQWNQRLALYIDQELTARGVARILPEKNFDLFVSYNMNVVLDPNGNGEIVKVGVRVWDPRLNNRVVWSAVANDQYSKDDAQNAAAVQRLIQTMFQQYPTGN
jgi:phage I-like protein